MPVVNDGFTPVILQAGGVIRFWLFFLLSSNRTGLEIATVALADSGCLPSCLVVDPFRLGSLTSYFVFLVCMLFAR